MDLYDKERAATAAGLRFVSVPDLASALSTLRELSDGLADGAHVVTHCRAGIGRASLLAAALLILGGTDPDLAWHALEEARGLAVPDTPEQREWTLRLLSRAA
ncbi:tyrosine protein phosphatase [Streptomyces niveus]|uniref:tyrosine protein phosphatase n=1 Tax=Streptomyces niveus TaxID=193462 RepID=UPI0036696BEF